MPVQPCADAFWTLPAAAGRAVYAAKVASELSAKE